MPCLQLGHLSGYPDTSVLPVPLLSRSYSILLSAKGPCFVGAFLQSMYRHIYVIVNHDGSVAHHLLWVSMNNSYTLILTKSGRWSEIVNFVQDLNWVILFFSDKLLNRLGGPPFMVGFHELRQTLRSLFTKTAPISLLMCHCKTLY